MNNPIKSIVPTIGKAVATTHHELVHAATRVKEAAKYIAGGEAPESTKNFKARSDNSNYYKGSSFWGKNKN